MTEAGAPRRLGTSSLHVRPVGFGASTLGRPGMGLETPREVDRAVGAAIDAGIDLVDVAELYGSPPGRSEELLGSALRGRREAVVISSKFGRHGPGGAPPAGFATRAGITASLEASLRRLHTDRIDLYQIHFPDPATPAEETIAALQDLVRAGRIRAWGVSNLSAQQLSAWLAAAGADPTFATATAEYSLLWREPERSAIPLLAEGRKSLIPYFPLQNGLLTGKYRYDEERRALVGTGKVLQAKRHLIEAAPWPALRAFAGMADALGISPAQLALAWLLHRPAVGVVIPGATTAPQLRENAAAGSISLPESLVEELTALFDGELSGRPGEVT